MTALYGVVGPPAFGDAHGVCALPLLYNISGKLSNVQIAFAVIAQSFGDLLPFRAVNVACIVVNRSLLGGSRHDPTLKSAKRVFLTR